MKNKLLFLTCCILLSLTSLAQKEKMSREEKDEKNEARNARINYKNDIALFRKQMLALKEYGMERQKIPAVQKSSKSPVKVLIVIDSNDNDVEGSKTLSGAIRQDVGDNSTTMYEITFDRTQRKIIGVKHTQEAIDAEREISDEKKEKNEEKLEKKANRKAEVKEVKKPVKKKTGDEDEDDDTDDDKPAKGKQQDDDE